MCTKDISDNLDGNVLKSFMSFGKAMQEESEILLGKILSVVSVLQQSGSMYRKLPDQASSTGPSIEVPFRG